VKGRAIELTGSVEVLLREAVWALKGSEPQRLLARTVEELGPGGQRDGNRAEAGQWFVADLQIVAHYGATVRLVCHSKFVSSSLVGIPPLPPPPAGGRRFQERGHRRR